MRLGDHVLVEPLIAGFPAWWCTLPPVTCALHVARYVLPLLEAYAMDPETSYECAMDPEFAGGRFIAVPPSRARDVEALHLQVQDTFKDAVALSDAVADFEERLVVEGKGQSLEPFYAQLPAPLRGRVELVYDYHNRASLRFDEGLAYASTLYRPDAQELNIRVLAQDGRPFYVTTPTLRSDGDLVVKRRFDDPRVRRLFRTDVEPCTSAELRDILEGADGAFGHLFSEGLPRVAPAWDGPQPRARYVGHACVLVEHAGKSVLLDPFLEVRPISGQKRFSYDDLPAHIDFVAITHAHTDHFALETLARLAPRIGTLLVPKAAGLLVGDVSLKRIAERVGIANVRELDSFESVRAGDLEITATPFFGEHGDLGHGTKLAYLVRAGGHVAYFAADSTCLDIEATGAVRGVHGHVDSVFMNTETEGAPISWPFDALFPRKRARDLELTRRCRGSNYDEGLLLLTTLGAKQFFNYAMGLEPWLSRILGPASGPETPRMQSAAQLAKAAEARGIEARVLNGSCDFMLSA